MTDVHTPEVQRGNLFRGDVSTGENGTLNAFGGDQHNYYLSASALRRRIRYASDPGRLDRELRLVVPPPGLEEDLAVLRETRLLMIAGGSRTGLSTAARHRWKSFAAEHPGHLSEELFASEVDELIEDLGHLDRSSVLLLDISHDHDLAAQLAERSAQVLAALHERTSHLVIAVGDAALPAAERTLRESVRRLGRPDPVAVMAKRMRRADLLRELGSDDRFTRHLVGLWPPNAVQVAELLDDMPPGTAPDALIKAITSRLNSWEEELSPLFEHRLTNGAARALLLATSALEGTGRDSIAFAARALAEVAGEELNPSVLADPSLNQQFEALESALVPGSGKFKKAGYGEAVLPFAWRQFPTWRTPIRLWLDLLLRPQQLEDDTLAVLLPRLLNFASATGAADLVTERAASIAGESGEGSKLRRELAAGLLLAGAIDPSVGQQVRRQLWRWSYHRSGVSVALQRTVAQVCGDAEYAVRFPRNALTRLKHLLKSEVPSVNGAAMAALVSAARSLPPQTLIAQVTEWISQRNDPRLRAVAPTVVIALVDDEQVRARWAGDRLARDTSGTVASLWHAVLTHASPGPVREAVAGWLALAAATPPEYRAILTDHLLVAAGNFWTLGQLSQALNESRWSGRDVDGEILALRDRLADHLSQAKVSL